MHVVFSVTYFWINGAIHLRYVLYTTCILVNKETRAATNITTLTISLLTEEKTHESDGILESVCLLRLYTMIRLELQEIQESIY